MIMTNIQKYSNLISMTLFAFFVISLPTRLLQAAVNENFSKIIAPSNSSNFNEKTTINVTVAAQHPKGIEVVRLWVNDKVYGLKNDAPYTFKVTGLKTGSHKLIARVMDNAGNAYDSPTINFTITKSNQTNKPKKSSKVTNNQPSTFPFVNITTPSGGSTISTNTHFTVKATAFDPDGIVATRLWINDKYYGLDSTAPYEFLVNGLEAGTHKLEVNSKDSLGNILKSKPIFIQVAENKPLTKTAEKSKINPNPHEDARSDRDVIYNPNPGSNNTTKIQLPIEVFGSSGTKKHVSFDLDNIDKISHLYLRCNNCGYHDIAADKNLSMVKASVRINGESPINLKHFTEKGSVYGNKSIEILGGEKNYGGIGGGFRTVRFLVPVNGLVKGRNTITFEHRNALSPSIGFRIIDMNFIRNNNLDRLVLSNANFNHDSPATWSAPLNNSADIKAGAELWRKRNSLYDIGVDMLDGRGNGAGPVNGQLRASCADCHAKDGRDLKYFNFSNYSIVQRSVFHKLSEKEGLQIASYIRSINIPTVSQARPWNPAYQPGPNLDSRPEYEWAAGAGIDAVLDEDSEMMPYLFPKGTSLDAVRNAVDRYDTLNFRELPVNIPMPDWNQWLPHIHPDDAFNTSASAINSDDKGKSVGMPYYEKLYKDALANPTPKTIGALNTDILKWLRRDLTCQSSGLENGSPMRALNGAVMTSLRIPAIKVTTSNCTKVIKAPADIKPHEIVKQGLTGYLSVKMWEIIHTNGLESESRKMNKPICSAGRCIDASEPRGWVVEGRTIFNRAPHYIGSGGNRNFTTQSGMLGIMESNSWYHLNMILNPGYRISIPSHFAYTYSHVELLQRETKVGQGFRFWATMIKQRQIQTNGKYGIEDGLDLRTAQPYVYYGTGRHTTNTDTQSNVGQPLWGRLAQAMIEDFVADANMATSKNWADANQNRKVQPRESTNFSACGKTCTFDLDEYQGRNTYRVIPKLREIGVSNSAINDLIAWGKKTWPNGPWDNLR